jgi:hypothetical protein
VCLSKIKISELSKGFKKENLKGIGLSILILTGLLSNVVSVKIVLDSEIERCASGILNVESYILE